MDSELEGLKKRRMGQLRQAYAEQLERQTLERQQAEAEARQQLDAVEEAVKAHMTKEALQRYSTVKLAHPEKATQLLIAIAQAIDAGRLKGMLTEQQLVTALKQLSRLSQQQQQRKVKIVRK